MFFRFLLIFVSAALASDHQIRLLASTQQDPSHTLRMTVDQKTTSTCKSIDLKSFHKNHLNQGKTKIVFFASWCSNCKVHMIESTNHKTIFIAAFDSKENANEIISAFNLKSPCYISKEIVDHYKVEYLPDTREVIF